MMSSEEPLLDETALLLAGLPSAQRHPPLGPLLVAHGIIRTVCDREGAPGCPLCGAGQPVQGREL